MSILFGSATVIIELIDLTVFNYVKNVSIPLVVIFISLTIECCSTISSLKNICFNLSVRKEAKNTISKPFQTNESHEIRQKFVRKPFSSIF